MCMFTHTNYTHVYINHTKHLWTFSVHSFWLHMHITMIKKNLIGKFPSEIYLRWLFSLRNSTFLSDYDCFPLECSWKKGKKMLFSILLQIFFLFKMSTTQLHVRETSGELYWGVFSMGKISKERIDVCKFSECILIYVHNNNTVSWRVFQFCCSEHLVKIFSLSWVTL